MANIEKNHDFTTQVIKVKYEGEIQNLSFQDIEKLLNEKCSLRSSNPFAVWGSLGLVIQSWDISVFAQNFAHFLSRKIYFNEDTIFKMNIEMGSVHLFKMK